jgi:hypothetical protein
MLTTFFALVLLPIVLAAIVAITACLQAADHSAAVAAACAEAASWLADDERCQHEDLDAALLADLPVARATVTIRAGSRPTTSGMRVHPVLASYYFACRQLGWSPADALRWSKVGFRMARGGVN